MHTRLKRNQMQLLALVLCSVPLFAQTRLETTQLYVHQLESSAPTRLHIFAVGSTGGAVLVQLGSNLKVTQTGTIWRIDGAAAEMAPEPTAVHNEWFEVTTANQCSSTFTLRFGGVVPSSVIAYRNGLRMAPGADFTVNGNRVTFGPRQTSALGDIVLFDYQHN
jgi:hypothetical protein